MSGWLGVLNVFGAIAGFFRWLTGWEHRKAGRTEAELDAARRESERGKARKQIDAQVGGSSASDLDRELFGPGPKP